MQRNAYSARYNNADWLAEVKLVLPMHNIDIATEHLHPGIVQVLTDCSYHTAHHYTGKDLHKAIARAPTRR